MGKPTGWSSRATHRVWKIGHDHWRMSWSYDTKIAGSRLRWPRTMTRDTDFKGACRFAKKWGLVEPTDA